MKKIFTLFLAALCLFCAVPKAQAAPVEEVQIPVIMYHKVTKNSGLLGKYAIRPADFESDLKYIKENGYTAVTMTDLISFVHYGVLLPEKPVVLTFDDGNFSDYNYVFPLLKEYEIPAVISIIGRVTDEYTAENRQDINYPHLTWFQIQEMADSGYVEIQSHSYDLHCERSGVLGARRQRGEDEETYAARLEKDLSKLQDRSYEMIGFRPNTFTYPFGAYSQGSNLLLASMGFYASLICEERVNYVTIGDPECLYGMGRILRPYRMSSEELFNHVEAAID